MQIFSSGDEVRVRPGPELELGREAPRGHAGALTSPGLCTYLKAVGLARSGTVAASALTTTLGAIRLGELMDRSSGRPEIGIGLIDGPVFLSHPDLVRVAIQEVSDSQPSHCLRADSRACRHGTFVAGVLSARRTSIAPAICPGCTLLVRPVFSETDEQRGNPPRATAQELAEAVVDCVNANARLINLSSTLVQTSTSSQSELVAALDYAASRGVITVAAAGNEGKIGTSVVTAHRGVIPVTACDLHGRLLPLSNLGRSIGTRGVMAPGMGITSLSPTGASQTLGGTSAATPLVTGVLALLWSVFPNATATRILQSLLRARPSRSVGRRSVAPPLLDASAAYITMTRIAHL